MSKLKVSVVIPAYNEVENFRRGVLGEVFNYLKNQDFSWEVVLVNDGSTDLTFSLLQNFAKSHPGFRVLDITHGGKVAAVTAGVIEAKGETILFTDFDQSTPISELVKVLEEFKSSADLVIGERQSTTSWSFFQNLRSQIFNLVVQLIALPGIKDSQCGFKAFKNKIGKDLFSKLQVTQKTQKGGYMGAFDVELLYLARKLGYQIVSIPVRWRYYQSRRLSFSEPIKMLRDIILVRFYDLLGRYPFLASSGVRFHLVSVILLLFLTIPAFWGTLKPGYFPMHDDLQAMRQLVMDKCFRDFQIPCRWSEDLGYGFGYPLFNFYPPLPYYFGQVIHWLGFQFVDIVKVLIVLNFLASGLAMYLLAQSFWGRWGGLLSAILYVYAPYHAVDIYVRAAMNEAWALVWFPAIFWALYKLISTNRWIYVSALSVFVALLMLSHNPLLMVFAPGAFLWGLFWLIQSHNFKSLLKLLVASFWALGLAAFFTLPVILEQKFVHIETLVTGYFNYLAHFVNLNQLFISRFWGYGDSRFGPVDDMSFQIGHLHWILSLASLVVALIFYYKKRFDIYLMIVLFFGMTLLYTFMTHQRSSFIWQAFPQLQYLQFPWRFLVLSIFGTSFLAGSIVLLLKEIPQRAKMMILFGLVIFTILFYKDYFHWKGHWPWVSDQVKFSGELWRLQITSGIFDYLPKWAPLPPKDPPKGDAEMISGDGEIKKIFKNSTKQQYQVKVRKEGVFQINTLYFPGWRYFVNGREVKVDPTKDQELGRPTIKLPPGDYQVIAKLTNTPIRNIGNLLSIISWIVLFFVVIYPRIQKFR